MITIKKLLTCAILGTTLSGGLVSCDTLEDKFYNPDKLTKADFSLLFSSAETKSHLFRYEYGPTYHYMRGFGKMLGLGVSPLYLDKSQNTSIVRPWDGWSGAPFNYDIFEKTNTAYSREINGMKLLYEGMTDEEKAENMVYMRCCDIIQCYAFQRSTDLYDDIPYFEVGGAFQEKFYPKYDTQEQIYDDMMKRLKLAVEDLSQFEFKTDANKLKFGSVDILCHGDLDKWIRFANSLRLRMAMRLCHVKPEVTISTVKELIAGNRMLTEYKHDIGFEEKDKTHAFEVTFFRGLDERGYECGAPATIIKDIMNYTYQEGDENGIDRHDFDPRLFAMFQPDIHGRYIGLPLTMEEAETELPKYYSEEELKDMYHFEDVVVGPWDKNRIPAMYNRRTYFNFDMQYPVMGSTETNLLLAEAAVRWPGEFGNINAKECIMKAIDSSTRFYYQTNNSMTYNDSSLPSVQHIKESAKAPNMSEIEGHLQDYKVFAANKFENLPSVKDKLKFIFDQKFCHMNVMNPYELFNEARRLVKDFDGELPFVSTPNVVFQERFYYPTSELTNNSENFQVVAHKNSYDIPVWWSGRTKPAKNHNGNALN